MRDRFAARVVRIGMALALVGGLASNRASEALAQDVPAVGTETADRPRIALVLGGGGARGGAHLGVLEVLEEMRVPVDLVAGTSFGAFVGALYASGMPVDEIRRVLMKTDWDLVFSPDQPRDEKPFREKTFDSDFLIRYGIGIDDEGNLILPLGLVPAQRLMGLLDRLLQRSAGIVDFSRLRVPYAAVTTDFSTGSPHAVRRGSLPQAVYASMAVPGLLPPTQLDGRMLVDGGIAQNVPVATAREMGADIIIVVDIGSPFHEPDDIQSFVTAMDQVVKMATRRNVERTLDDIRENEILLQPELDGISTASFDKLGEAIRAGIEVANASRDRLAPLAMSPEAYREYRDRRTALPQSPDRIVKRIEIENGSYLGDASIRRRLTIREGEPLDEHELRDSLSRLYAVGAFEDVSYELVEEEDGTIVRIVAQGRRAESGRMRLGLRIEDDLSGQNSYTVAGEYRLLGLNELGAEARFRLSLGETMQALAEWYQPLDSLQRWFVNAQVDYTEENVNLFDDGDIVSQFRVHEAKAALAAGRVFGNWGEIRAGVLRGVGRVDTEVGPIDLDEDFDSGAVFARFTIDTLDRAFFPRHGHFVVAQWEDQSESLGSDSDFETLQATFGSVHSFGRQTAILSLSGGTLRDRSREVQGALTLGGFLNLSGFQYRELTGTDIALGRLIAYRRLVGDAVVTPASMPIYLGASLEAGQAWLPNEGRTLDSLILGGSVFVGVESIIGPLYLGGGLAEGGNRSLYLFIGDPF